MTGGCAIRDTADVSRLLFTPEPVDGESLIGLVARATRENVLERTSILLQKCAPTLFDPGTIGQDILDPHRLAIQLGCSTQEILKRCHPYLSGDRGVSHVRWGNGEMFRLDLITTGRRISPASLRSNNYHRASWMNRLLPYCSESLELLIDRCQICGRKQDWKRAWGIGNCDDPLCRAELLPQKLEALAQDLVPGYRFFAQIVSPISAERDKAVSKLESDLAALPPATLINLIFQVGTMAQDSPFFISRTALRNLSAFQIAKCVSVGTNLVLDWPLKLRGAVGAMLDAQQSKGPDHRAKFVKIVRRLGSRSVTREQADLVAKGIPEAFEHAATALAALVRPVVPANVICRTMHISTKELEAIRVAGLIEHRVIVDGKRKQIQFDADEFEALAECQRKSAFASRFEQNYGLPRYAVEQLVCLGEIRHEDHPALALINPTLRIIQESADDFSNNLWSASSERRRPGDAIPLGTASHILGGGPKPWGSILTAMRKGELQFWLSTKGKFIRRAFVRPSELIPFTSIKFCEASWPKFSFKDAYTQIDAAEILNLDALQIRRSIQAGELKFRSKGVSLLTDRRPVLRLAANHVSASEIALRTGRAPNTVHHLMKKFPHIPKSNAGWDRSAFYDEFG
ncbi:MAG: hypothetical protein ABGW87_07135 [Sphingomonadaceae bacterium]